MPGHESLQESLQTAYQQAPEPVQTVLQVLVVIIVGAAVAWALKKYAVRLLERAPRIDRTLQHFLARLVSTGTWLVVLVVALTVAGVDLAALLGGIAIGGFVLGFALKDTLGNLAAGVVLLFYRPFNVGDAVTIASHTGEVASLGVALTTLHAADGRIVTLPNGKVLGDAIVNLTRSARRRIDVTLRLDFKEDLEAVVTAALQVLRAHPDVMDDPAPSVLVTGTGESSVELLASGWVPTGRFGAARHSLHVALLEAVEETGSRIAYPQRTLHQV